jgi:hypothetical protein
MSDTSEALPGMADVEGKRGPGRPRKITTDEAAVSEQVTYIPRDGDPAKVTWRGLVFHANAPKTLTDAAHIEAARNNKWFKVGPFDPATDGVPSEASLQPKTPEQYRAHAIEWFKKAKSVDEIDTKWTQEETLRMACGVGSDDLEYLMGLFTPMRGELRKREIG